MDRQIKSKEQTSLLRENTLSNHYKNYLDLKPFDQRRKKGDSRSPENFSHYSLYPKQVTDNKSVSIRMNTLTQRTHRGSFTESSVSLSFSNRASLSVNRNSHYRKIFTTIFSSYEDNIISSICCASRNPRIQASQLRDKLLTFLVFWSLFTSSDSETSVLISQ